MRPSTALTLLLAERERRAREQKRSLAERQDAVEAARDGDPRPYVRLQWPTLKLETWQLDALFATCDPSVRVIAIKGNTGCGKNLVGGIASCLYYDMWDDARLRISRDTYDNAVSMAFNEVSKWWRRMAYKPAGNLLTAGIDGGPERWLQVVNPRTNEGFHGVHSSHVLYWLDEATAPNLQVGPDGTSRYEAVMTQAHKLLATANPRTLAGWFRDLFPRDDPDTNQTVTTHHGVARCLTVSAYDCTNVREKRLSKPIGPIGGIEIKGRRFRHGEPIPPEYYREAAPIIPGQTCYDEAQVYLTHPDPFQRNVMGLGRFPKSDPVYQLIDPDWLGRQTDRWRRWKRLWDLAVVGHPLAGKLLDRILPVECFGLDVGASDGGDPSILAPGGQRGIRDLHECQFADTTQTVAWVIETAQTIYGIDLTRGEHPVGVDYGGGYGNAVGDPLRNRGVLVIEIRGNATSDVDPKRYGNKRAELYGEMGRRLDPKGDWAESPYALPDDQQLRAELCAPQKIFAGQDGQKFYITPKDRRGASQNFKGQTIKEMLGRSPDKGDAAVYCLEASRHVGMSLDGAIDAGFF